ncbi:MAG: hypothetical protein PHE78_08630 [Candidatus Gastranaerophilales bacterium]|nr:hypothetical protein [Candidatus Gastranaerophilales bacterium]
MNVFLGQQKAPTVDPATQRRNKSNPLEDQRDFMAEFMQRRANERRNKALSQGLQGNGAQQQAPNSSNLSEIMQLMNFMG